MSAWRDAALTAALTLCSVLLTGYQFGVSDQLLFLPTINGWLSPTGFHPSDLLVHHIWTTQPTIFWFLLVPLFRWLTLPQTLFLVYLLSQWAYFAAVYALATRLLGHRAAAAVAVLLLILPKPVGGTWIDTHCVYLVPRTVAVPLALWGFYALLNQQGYVAAGLMALAFDIHPLSAVPWMLVMGYALLAERRSFSRTERVGSWALLVGGILPLLIWRGASHESGDWFASAAWLEIIHRRTPYFITAWSWSDWSPVCVSALAWLVAHPDVKPSPDDRHVSRLMWVVGGLAVVSIVCTEFLFVPIVFQLQLLRAAQYLIIVAAIYFAGYLRGLWHHRPFGPWLAVVLCYAFFAMWPLLFFGALAAGLLWQRAGHHRQGRRWHRADALLMVTVVVAVLELSFGASLANRGRTIPVVGAWGLLWVLYDTMRRKCKGAKRLAVLAGVVCLAATAVWLDEDVQRVARSPVSALRQRIAWPFGQAADDDWIDVQRWARTRTPPGSLFITPPHREGFRLWSGRSPVIEYKDGALGMFSSRVGLEWWRRIQDLHGWPPEKGRTQYQAMTEPELATVARTYGAGYVVVDRPKRLAWQRLHENPTFTVYAVPGGAAP